MRILFLSFLVLLLNSSFALAQLPKISISGFGTAAFMRSDESRYYLQEYDTSGKKLTFIPDSRLGVNLNSKISDEWSATSQFISKADNDNYSISLDWGFISYQPIPEISFRAGKVISPLWLYSQQISVGYSYIWIRPPVEVYSLLSGVRSLSGASILTNYTLGEGVLSAEVFGGASNEKTTSNDFSKTQTTTVQVHDGLGLDVNYNYADLFTLHGSYAQANVEAKVESTTAGPASSLYYATLTPLSLKFARFFSFGGKFDHNNILLTGEFARRLISGQAMQSVSAWYVTGGYRFNKLTPYYSYSKQANLKGSYWIHPNYPTVTALKTQQFSHLLGINYQLNDSVILKGELQKTEYRFNDSSKNFKVGFYSASADFIF